MAKSRKGVRTAPDKQMVTIRLPRTVLADFTGFAAAERHRTRAMLFVLALEDWASLRKAGVVEQALAMAEGSEGKK
jgi:hypothetical protein